MSASIVLDEYLSPFTNLDTISGKLSVRTLKSIAVSAITIKLEGDARTRLIPPATPQERRPRPQLEYHKILYKTVTVFPPPGLKAQQDGGNNSFTLPPGQHEYPFSFKIPFNTSCALDEMPSPQFSIGSMNLMAGNFAGMNLDLVRPSSKHNRGSLPPTLRGFPGEAEIRYFLKGTIARPNILKENIRTYVNFSFCPIEPPRDPSDGSESYARRKHQFAEPSPGPTRDGLKQKRSLFSLNSTFRSEGKVSSESIPTATSGPPYISIETRLPEPPILTLTEPLPLKLLCTTINEKTEGIFLHSLQIDLAHYTRIRAHALVRVETGSTVLLSKSNLSIPLAFDAETSEALLPSKMWNEIPIPVTLPPSFECCNITRNYELIVRIGLRWDASPNRPQHIHLDLKNPVKLYSGIPPTPEILAALKSARRPSNKSPTSGPPPDEKRPPLPQRKPVSSPVSRLSGGMQKGSSPGRVPGAWPSGPSSLPGADAQGRAPRYSIVVGNGPMPGPASRTSSFPGTTGFAPGVSGSSGERYGGVGVGEEAGAEGSGDGEVYSDAPPSYEDAVADVLPPMQVGERRGYVPPNSGAEGQGGSGEDRLLPSDEKAGWH